MRNAVESRKAELIRYLVEVAGFNHAVSCGDALLYAVETGLSEGVAILIKVDGVDIAAARQLALHCGSEADVIKMLSSVVFSLRPERNEIKKKNADCDHIQAV
ncbi:hypothetical protein HDU76_008410 [Blyttiomyces sp. JEL0837]|nr:hypothetical protein HDU76_008410 [Blyttiomyces sp. JEL0837]